MENCDFCGNKMNFVRYEIANKRIQIRKQCFNCGLLDTTNYKFSDFENINELPFYSKEKREEYKETRSFNSELRRSMIRKEYYNDVYLKSDEWKRKRENVLKRDNYKCVCCGNEATQVHHINYNNVYKENIKELLSVCKPCHEKIHFNGVVFFNGFKANFGTLGHCQNCKEYHINGNSILCTKCLNKTYEIN